MGVDALGVANRGVIAEIVPNHHDHLECDECGACIDICPVGALTSGSYRYQTRPWEMNHVGTICTHCADGCRTTLGVRNEKIIRGNNRDRSGINGEFLCIKGRYGFDFTEHPERLQSPLMRVDGKLEPVSWSEALEAVAKKFSEVKARGGHFGVIGSSHTTNEENYYLQKFARQVLGTKNIDHHRTRRSDDVLRRADRRANVLATMDDLYNAKAVLVVASDLSQQHPMLANQIRANAGITARVSTPSRGSGARGQAGGGQRARGKGRGSRRSRIVARKAGGRRRSGDAVRRNHPGRQSAQIDRLRRFARAFRSNTFAWWMIPIRAAPSTWA